MRIRRLAWAAALGLSVFSPRGGLLAAEPLPLALPVLTSPTNQQQADVIAGVLRQSAVLKTYQVGVTVRGGDVELDGTVANQGQREEVVRLVQGIPGVQRVLDHMKVSESGGNLIRVDGPAIAPPPPLPEPVPVPGPGEKKDGPVLGGGPLPEPEPMYRQHGNPAYSELTPPRMPPYAWPTYAPYNNFSRVGYPEAYPWQSWPFIGPVYPFPKVPLGWRSVKLEWDDGHWWYGQVGNKYNWWKLRYK